MTPPALAKQPIGCLKIGLVREQDKAVDLFALIHMICRWILVCAANATNEDRGGCLSVTSVNCVLYDISPLFSFAPAPPAPACCLCMFTPSDPSSGVIVIWVRDYMLLCYRVVKNRS